MIMQGSIYLKKNLNLRKYLEVFLVNETKYVSASFYLLFIKSAHYSNFILIYGEALILSYLLKYEETGSSFTHLIYTYSKNY